MEEETSANETVAPEVKAEFKMPVLVGRVGKLPKKAKTESSKSTEGVKKEEKPEVNNKPKSSLPPAVLLKEMSTPIPYKEPNWSGLCPDGSDYGLEVLKSGLIVDKVDLTKQPYYVFGRLANCDVVMAHPTISRHHAVLQYKAFAEEDQPPSGWYLYDLGSTHGTYLNRERLKPNHYTRARVGHQIKFGTSTRTYIVLGPDFDCEGESELSVTEIKQRAQEMKKDRDRAIQEAIEQREKDRIAEEKRKEEQGIDWGMGEDAEDEPDLSENPYAVTTNEELYLEDPKKTLRGYFEREGFELTYNCEERGVGQFLCRVELPMDDARGKPIQAEVLHKGKKKEAVIACALEACRILDRAGLLRQSKHESRARKQRDWNAEDFYDSDDDNYLDRTGVVENKRKFRMRKYGGEGTKEEEKPLTYDGLLTQISELEQKIQIEEKSLQRLREQAKPTESNSEEDSLDSYMTSLKQGPSMSQKAEISSTKLRIQKFKAELTKTQRLAEIARPAHLPPLVKQDKPKMAVKMAANSVVYGKRIRLKEDSERRPRISDQKPKQDSEFVEEVDSDEEQEKNDKKIEHSRTEHTENTEKEVEKKETEDQKVLSEKETKDEVKVERTFGPMRPPDNYVIPENYFNQESDRDLPEIMDDDV